MRKFLPVLCAMIYAATASIGAFTGGIWAGFGIGLAVLLFFGVWIADQKPPLPPRQLSLFVIGVLIMLAAELPFSEHFAVSFHKWAELVTIFLPLLLLTSPRVQQAARSDFFVPAVSLAAFIGALALGLELGSGGPFLHMLGKPAAALTDYNRGIAHLAILAFPLCAGLWVGGGKRAACILALTLLYPMGLTESHTAKLALIVGALCTASAFYKPKWVQGALTFFCALIMGWPFYARWLFTHDYNAVETWHLSWRHRMEIWDYLSYRIAERPLFGWGLGSTHLLDFTQPHGNLYQIVTQGAPHAHNLVVEIWVETGLVGLGLGLVFLTAVLRKAGAIHPSLRPFALGGVASALIVSMFGFDFWTDALWAAFALSACAFGMIEQNIKRPHHPIDA